MLFRVQSILSYYFQSSAVQHRLPDWLHRLRCKQNCLPVDRAAAWICFTCFTFCTCLIMSCLPFSAYFPELKCRDLGQELVANARISNGYTAKQTEAEVQIQLISTLNVWAGSICFFSLRITPCTFCVDKLSTLPE